MRRWSEAASRVFLAARPAARLRAAPLPARRAEPVVRRGSQRAGRGKGAGGAHAVDRRRHPAAALLLCACRVDAAGAGNSEWALRFPSAAFGPLTVALLWSARGADFRARRRARLAAALAALFAAVSPLYVYYGQEARMYTQLAFFAALAGVRPVAGSRASRARWWLAFVARRRWPRSTPTTSRFSGWSPSGSSRCGRAWRQGSPPALALSAGAALRSATCPWLPAMLTRYRVDASYWQGALKLNEALRHVAISWTTGAPETMLEADAVRWLPVVRSGAASRRRRADLWLTAPTAGRRAADLLALLVARGRPSRSRWLWRAATLSSTPAT